MNVAPNATVNVEGIGTFTFAPRSMRNQFRIKAEYARLTEGVHPVDEDLDVTASAVATLKVLTVEAPDGWDIDAMDPLEDETYAKILKVFGALRAREESFRKRGEPGGEAAGAGDRVDAGVLVSPPVPARAD